MDPSVFYLVIFLSARSATVLWYVVLCQRLAATTCSFPHVPTPDFSWRDGRVSSVAWRSHQTCRAFRRSRVLVHYGVFQIPVTQAGYRTNAWYHSRVGIIVRGPAHPARDILIGACLADNHLGYNWTIILPAELSAAAVLINFWTKAVNNAVWITICLVVVITINMFGAGAYGECEFIFA